MTREKVREKVVKIIADELAIQACDLRDDSNLSDDLGADSLSQTNIVIGLEAEFDITISNEEAKRITTVGEAVDHIQGALHTL